ncbi:MAG: outer membrane lipoprotein-sorting protein [Balneolales bacterium]|nr:outer membrane lipoprotein-sorting protein [Balneolales bacterium]
MQTTVNLENKYIEKIVAAVLIVLLLLCISAASYAGSEKIAVIATDNQSENAREIISKMNDTMRGESSYSEMSMTIERPRYTREVSMRSWAQGTDYSMILITAPSRDAGTTFLKRKNEIWNYVPNVDRTIKMPPSMMSQSWMGSDFTNDDLVNETSIVDDFNHSILREETYDGRESWVIEMIPHEEAAVVWGKVLVWVCKEDFIQLRVESYDQSGDLAQTMKLDRIKNLGGRMLPSRMIMTPADKDQKTTLEYKTLEFGITEGEDFFTQRNMQRIR